MSKPDDMAPPRPGGPDREKNSSFEDRIIALLANGQADEARQQLDRALDEPDQLSNAPARCLALLLRGEVELHEGEPAIAAGYLAEADCSIEAARLDPATRLRLRFALAEAIDQQGEPDAAKQGWANLATLAAELDDPRSRVMALSNQSLLLQAEENFEEAESCLIEAINLVQDHLGESDPLLPNLFESLGTLYWTAGYPDACAGLYREAIEASRNSPDLDHSDNLRLRGNFAAVLYQNAQLDDSVAEFERLIRELEENPVDELSPLEQCLENAEAVLAHAGCEELATRARRLRKT